MSKSAPGSKDVARILKKEVFPLLQGAGFREFTTRTAWKTSQDVIAVVNFRSLGSYLGSRVGFTSHSFVVTVGLYYKAMHAVPWAKDPVPSHPEEWQCQARRVLKKSIFQFWHWRPDVWYVDSKAANLDGVIRDVRRTIEQQAIPWLEEFSDLRRALKAFESRKGSQMLPGIACEILGGRLGSFARAEAASALALACGEKERAKKAWHKVLANPYYRRLTHMREQAEERIVLIDRQK